LADGARMGIFEPGESTQAFGELLRTLLDAERFPALLRAVEAGAFDPSDSDAFTDFGFGLGIMLDGVERLMQRQRQPES
jgi:hypothetical protein